MSAGSTGLELPAALLGPCPHGRQAAFSASNRLLITQEAVAPRTPLGLGPNAYALPSRKQLKSNSGGPCAGLLGPELGECLQAATRSLELSAPCSSQRAFQLL